MIKNRHKIILVLIGLALWANCAFGQLSLVSTMDNPTWEGLFNPPSGEVLYQYPSAVCPASRIWV